METAARRSCSALVRPLEAPTESHTRARAASGTGASGRLMEALSAEIRSRGLQITPVCGYAAAWLRRSETYRSLLD
jgi:predicted GNAT family acetyltransferase